MTPFVLRMAAREIRAAPRRLLLLTASVAVGVAALVAIDSFTDNLRTLRARPGPRRSSAPTSPSRAGGRSTRAAEARARHARARAAAEVARLTSFSGMAYVPRTSGTRLVQVAAVEPGYPVLRRDPDRARAPRGRELQRGRRVVVDPSLLTALDARVGDTLSLGEARFVITGIVDQRAGQRRRPRRVRPADLHPGARPRRRPGCSASAPGRSTRRSSGCRPTLSPQALAAQLPARLLAPSGCGSAPWPRTSANLNDALGRLTGYLGLVGAHRAAARRHRRGERGGRVHPPAARHHRGAALPRRHAPARCSRSTPLEAAAMGLARQRRRRARWASWRSGCCPACWRLLPVDVEPVLSLRRDRARRRHRALGRAGLRAAAAARRAATCRRSRRCGATSSPSAAAARSLAARRAARPSPRARWRWRRSRSAAGARGRSSRAAWRSALLVLWGASWALIRAGAPLAARAAGPTCGGKASRTSTGRRTRPRRSCSPSGSARSCSGTCSWCSTTCCARCG